MGGHTYSCCTTEQVMDQKTMKALLNLCTYPFQVNKHTNSKGQQFNSMPTQNSNPKISFKRADAFLTAQH